MAYAGIKIDDIMFIEVKGNTCEVNTINGMYISNNMSLINRGRMCSSSMNSIKV